MQSGFCTNCGQPLVAGAAFCPNCGAHVEAPPAAAATPASAVPPGTPSYAPGSNPPASFTPAPSAPPGAPAKPPKSQARSLVGWVVGCLALFLGVIAVFVVLLVVGILTHKLVLFAIGMGGLALVLLVGVIIEHQIRRLYRRYKYRIESNLGVIDRPLGARPGYRGSALPYHQQPRFSLIRFLFSLAVLAALVYGGLFLYYTQTFAGSWSGVLTIGTARQGVLVNLQISLPLHGPTNPSFSDPASLTLTQVAFKPAPAQTCKASQASYQLSGTASRLDASSVAMTLTTGTQTIQLSGTYQNNIFTLTGKNAQGQPVTLTLQKGSDQQAYLAACT